MRQANRLINADYLLEQFTTPHQVSLKLIWQTSSAILGDKLCTSFHLHSRLQIVQEHLANAGFVPLLQQSQSSFCLHRALLMISQACQMHCSQRSFRNTRQAFPQLASSD